MSEYNELFFFKGQPGVKKADGPSNNYKIEKMMQIKYYLSKKTQFFALMFSLIMLGVGFYFWKNVLPFSFSEGMFLNLGADIHRSNHFWRPEMWGSPVAYVPPPTFWPLAWVALLISPFSAQEFFLFARIFSGLCLLLLSLVLCLAPGSNRITASASAFFWASGFPLYFGFFATSAPLLSFIFTVYVFLILKILREKHGNYPVKKSHNFISLIYQILIFATPFVLILFGEFFSAFACFIAYLTTLLFSRMNQNSIDQCTITQKANFKSYFVLSFAGALFVSAIILSIGNHENFQIYVSQFVFPGRQASANEYPIFDKQGSFITGIFLCPLIAWTLFKIVSASNLWQILTGRLEIIFLFFLTLLLSIPIFSEHSFQCENAIFLALSLSLLTSHCTFLTCSLSPLRIRIARLVAVLVATFPAIFYAYILKIIYAYKPVNSTLNFKINESFEALGASFTDFKWGFLVVFFSILLLFIGIFFAVILGDKLKSKTKNRFIFILLITMPMSFPFLMHYSIKPWIEISDGALLTLTEEIQKSSLLNPIVRTFGILDPILNVMLGKKNLDLKNSTSNLQYATGDFRAFDGTFPLFVILPNEYAKVCSEYEFQIFKTLGLYTVCLKGSLK